MLKLYKMLTLLSAPLLQLLLNKRIKRGKEDINRLNERMGQPILPRPDGYLIWIHAASVGEAQSALILIDHITKKKPTAHFLVTSGTVTSANLMATRLPKNAIHQYIPLDHPKWVESFLNHWSPDLALWMESELWPNLLMTIKQKNIPAILINARLSDKSFRYWKRLKQQTNILLQSFDIILTQTEQDKIRYQLLGSGNVTVAGNLKQSADPLPVNNNDLKKLKTAIGKRPLWLFSSTHKGEEKLAARIHKNLKETYPNLLTIIAPRHPDRRNDIQTDLKIKKLQLTLRGEDKTLPDDKTDIYIADTLGELGLFYSLSPIAVIGRSFSDDGGGGHNPIEAAQLNCAVLTGPNIQFQQDLFNEMFKDKAATQTHNEEELLAKLKEYLDSPVPLKKSIDSATSYAKTKSHIIDHYMERVLPFVNSETKKAA